MKEEKYIPKHLKRWRLPDSYYGQTWPDYYVFLGRNRDSDIVTNSNYIYALEALGGEQFFEKNTDEEEVYSVTEIREGHWACGWIEWIGIHKDAYDKLKIADEIMERLERYTILDEDDVIQKEQIEAERIWASMDVEERIQYMRDHESEFSHLDWSDLMQNARGNWFSGYPSELIY